VRNPNEFDYRQMCYDACVCVEQRSTEANLDGNTDVGVADERQWLNIVWHQWRKRCLRDRIEQASARAWTAPERIDALVELKVERGGTHD
jgi:hypothetical protein